MPRVLVTAFEPFGPWATNSSWLTLEQLTSDLPASPQIVTRRYPVDFAALPALLERDLRENFDAALFLGQASGAAAISIEAIGLNVACEAGDSPDEAQPLVEDGPVAYRTEAPVEQWARGLRAAGIPARVSFHAGTYLCNATLYMAHYLIERLALRTPAVFIHLPLDLSQCVVSPQPHQASMPVEISTAAVRWILAELADRPLL